MDRERTTSQEQTSGVPSGGGSPSASQSGEARDTGYAPDRWSFDSEVTRVFDNMLDRSIPNLEAARDLTGRFLRSQLFGGGSWYDLGCSNGGMIAAVLEGLRHDVAVRVLGLDESEPMVREARSRFAYKIEIGRVDVRKHDLRTGLPSGLNGSVDVVSAFLTLMFVPVEYRLALIQDVYHRLADGGMFLVVEKLLGATADLNREMVGAYYDFKREMGYTQEEIDRKRLSLEGVLVPWTPEFLTHALTRAGFSQIDCYWRWMNFGGFVAVK